jgi:ribonuclease-3
LLEGAVSLWGLKLTASKQTLARETQGQGQGDPSAVSTVSGYSFTNPALLAAALTHCSVASSASNQRLEWLGDAVMDFVVRLLFEQFPSAQEGELSQRKSDATSNKALASVASVLRLHHWLEHRSPKLAAHFASVDAGLAAQAAGCAATELLDRLPPSCVKTLADTLEALVGAVYLDAGCDDRGLAAIRAFVLQVGILPRIG